MLSNTSTATSARKYTPTFSTCYVYLNKACMLQGLNGLNSLFSCFIYFVQQNQETIIKSWLGAKTMTWPVHVHKKRRATITQ